jgi:repressor LexA
MDELTKRQKEVLDHLTGFIRERGFPPTIRELARRLGMKGIQGAQKHLDALERKGFIRRTPNEARAIEVTHLPRLARVVPLLGQVSAGSPILAVENYERTYALDGSLFNGDDCFLVRVQGDSMEGAHIMEGDLVAVSPGSMASNGDIVVALLEDDVVVKRLRKEGERLRLESENPAYDPILLEDGGAEVQPPGKVTGPIRQLR